MSSQQPQLSVAKVEIDELKRQLQSKDELEGKMNEAKVENDELKRQLQSKDEELEGMMNEEKVEIDELKRQLQSKDEDNVNLKRQLSEVNSALESKDAEMLKLNEAKKDRDIAELKLQEALKNETEAKSNLKRQLNDKNVIEASLRQVLKNERQTKSNVDQQIVQLVVDNDKLKLQVTELRSELESKHEVMQLRIGAYECHVTELLGKLQKIQREKAEVENELVAITVKLREKEGEMKLNFENAQHTMRRNETSEKDEVQPTLASADESKQSDEVNTEIGTMLCFSQCILATLISSAVTKGQRS